VEIDLWNLYSWSACNDRIIFRLSKKVPELAPEAKGTHCVIRRCALAGRTSPTTLKIVLDSTINIANYIKSGNPNTCLFEELSNMFLIHKVLLFHMLVPWLLKGNFLNHIFEMKDKIKLFFELKANKFFSYISDKIWLKSRELNNFNLKLQGSVQTSSSFTTNLQAFYLKLQNWHHKVMQGSVATFKKLSSVVEKTEEHDEI